MRRRPIGRFLRSTRRGLAGVDRLLDGLDLVREHGVEEVLQARKEGWAKDADDLRNEVEPRFVLSPGRSGTMTLAALMSVSDRVHAEHEPQPRLVSDSFLRYWIDPDQLPPNYWRDALAHSRDPLIVRAHRRGRIYFESNNRITMLAGALALLYPRSSFLLVSRHPFDFVASAMARGYYQDHPWDFARLRPRPAEPLNKEWASMPRLLKCAWLWRRSYESALEQLEALDDARWMHLTSEELFTGSPELIASLFRFVADHDPPARTAIEQVLGKRMNRQASRPAGSRAEEWTADQQQSVLELVRPVAERFGYL